MDIHLSVGINVIPLHWGAVGHLSVQLGGDSGHPSFCWYQCHSTTLGAVGRLSVQLGGDS